MRIKLSDVRKDKIVTRVIDELSSMPKAHAAVTATRLYGTDAALRDVTDSTLKRSLCLALADYFKGTQAGGLAFWESFR